MPALDDEDTTARVTWSTIAEPADSASSWLIDTVGAAQALRWVRLARRDAGAATRLLDDHADEDEIVAALSASHRWLGRLDGTDPHDVMARARRCEVRAITPSSTEWPGVMDDLGRGAPVMLWARGDGNVAELFEMAVAVVGARAATAYGEHVATEVAAGVADHGWTVVSGGAYGIDVAAHRAALTVEAPTVAVMAGGLDRLYPAGNAMMLEQVCSHGVLVSELPPGYAPLRSRFLSRNRLIATARATVVVEAAARSGGLSTARHAMALMRPVGAVPGPVTAASSAGCLQLIRESEATLIRGVSDVLELAGPIGSLVPHVAVHSTSDGVNFQRPDDRRVFDVLSHRPKSVSDLAQAAALTLPEVRAALGRLQAGGGAEARDGGWVRGR